MKKEPNIITREYLFKTEELDRILGVEGKINNISFKDKLNWSVRTSETKYEE